MASLTPEQQKALDDYYRHVGDYVNGGPAKYSSVGDLALDEQGATNYNDIVTDPRYKDSEMAALRELEDESRNGFTAADRADIARTEGEVNRANRGRIGAIQQEMGARGMSGSGMDLVAQMSSAQDANDLAALKALEQEGAMQTRKSQATKDLGSMSAGLQQQEWSQAAAKAAAQDAIDRFNTQTGNQGATLNWQNNQNVSNNNVGMQNTFAGNALNANLGADQLGYNTATELHNQDMLEKQKEEEKKKAKAHAVGSVVGGVAGGVAGTFAAPGVGTAAGYQMGSQLGGGVADAAYWKGGRVPGEAEYPGDDPRNDTVLAAVSPGEEVESREDVERNDAVADLLDAVARLHKSRKK